MTDREFYKTVNKVIDMLMLNSPRCLNLDFKVITDTGIEATKRFETQKNSVNMTDLDFFQNLDKIIGMILFNEERCHNLNAPVIDEMLLEMVRRVNALTDALKKEQNTPSGEYQKAIHATVEALLKNGALPPI